MRRTEMEALAAEQRAETAQIAAEELAAQAELDAVIDMDGEEFIGSCPDPLRCEHRDRFPNGPWSCRHCHPRRSRSAGS